MAFISNLLLQTLIFLYQHLGQNFGLAIIALTLIIRTLLVPVTLPSLKSAQKMQALKPQLDKLKKKHKDKVKLQQAQMELYKQHGVNPMAGCLPQIVQLIILIALYRVFINFINQGQVDGTAVNMTFFWLDLSKPDPRYILPITAGLAQLAFSLMMRTGLESHLTAPKQKPAKKKEEDSLEMASAMQQQMTFVMPAMTALIALRFPSGLALYWVTTTLFSAVQQYIISGPGGLIYYKDRLLAVLKPNA